MSWIKENALSWMQLFCVNVVRTGHVPKHIAFIMDGNRRFAKKNNIDKGEGHSKGFDKLAEVLQWCLDLGVPEVTVYAFSIENFKRSKEELDALMSLAEDKFQRILDEKDLLMERGVCVQVVGRISLLSPKLRQLISKAMIITKDNSKAKLNVAFAYTGRDEITRAIGCMADAVKKGLITSEDLTEDLMDETLELSSPDLLIRTSGEVRLSDFMIWQVSDTCLYFTDILWPEFRIWNLLAAVIHFQRVYQGSFAGKKQNERHSNFLNYLNKEKWKVLESYSQAC